MLLRRQTSYNGIWKTRMIYDPADEWEEAGTVVWYSRWSYIAILVRKNGKGEKEVVVRWTDAENDKAVKVCLSSSSFSLIHSVYTDDIGKSRETHFNLNNHRL
jgi:hypothetical protein